MTENKKKRKEMDLFLKNKSKKGQITIFVILAICIVIVLFLLFTKKSDIVTIFSKPTPTLEIEKCIESAAKESASILSLQGGSINPTNYYLYNGSNVDYICYTTQYYAPCVMQKPMLKADVEKEISQYIDEKSVECLNRVKENYESQGYNVIMRDSPKSKVELIPNNIKVVTSIDMEISKENNQVFKQVRVNIASGLYDFIMITQSIANWEARYGDSETMNYMYFNPNLKVEKKTRSEGTKIYILTNRNSLDKFLFATRSYARPPGVTGN